MSAALRFLPIILLSLAFFSCGNAKIEKHGVSSSVSKDSLSAKSADSVLSGKKNYWNDISLYLAGLSPDTSDFVNYRLVNLPYYRQFCDSMNKGFSSIESSRLSKMRSWASTELLQESKSPRIIFYPFSGPDILHCIQFFPDADQYYLMALERYGSVPDIRKMDSTRLTQTLDYVHQSLEDIIGKSYFITRKMAVNVSNYYNGVAPLASIFLVRAGYAILYIRYKHLLDDGKTIVEIPIDSMGHHINECVEISFRKKGSTKTQKLTYFKSNIADDPYLGSPGLKTNTGLRNFLDSLPECYTYVKSASYRMCQSGFSIIRNTCLKKSKTILQDDTGIAFGFYDKDNWNITLYGNYEKPISDFQGGYYQAGLQAAYKADSSHIKPLPFSLGYHWKDQVQNLMIFRKK